MRQILLAFVLTTLSRNAALGQSGAAAKTPRACALLTPELVKKVHVASKRSDAAAPKEVDLGRTKAACEWGVIMLQVDPITPAEIDKLAKPGDKSWEVVSGVGDAAYFHNVSNVMGELFVRVGPRTLGVLMDIPSGSTAASFKPTFIEVAKAVVPKLR